MIYDSILDAVGHTPLVRLRRMVTSDMAEILVKFEVLNVGGSIKTRTALNMIRDAEARDERVVGRIVKTPQKGKRKRVGN